MAAAIATSRWAASLFYDTSPLEPRAFIGALLTLGGVVALAAVIPARRACVIDPREALVQE
jgi:ABC-type lipoprotein release transport system permease subunit